MTPFASDLPLGEASASVQRVALAPAKGWSPNLGAAPCVVLKSHAHELQLAVPVAPGEALWIGLMLPLGTEFVSAKVGEFPLQMQTKGVDASGAEFLRSVPFGAGNRVTSAEVVVGGPAGDTVLRIELSSADSFNRRFGLASGPQAASGSYGGWRLP